MQDTQDFWEILKIGKYDIFISEVVVNELSACNEPKRSDLFSLLSEISFVDTKIEGNANIVMLANDIKMLNILPPKSENDRRHIAAAIFNECDIIVSWNFSHMVNIKTIDGVRVICVANNVKPIDIYTPSVLLERSL